MNIPGTGVSTNVPLENRSVPATVLDGLMGNVLISGAPTQVNRPGIVEIGTGTFNGLPRILTPSESLISTYLMQNIRKVVNAIPLQEPKAYRDVLTNSAGAYALKKQLDKMITLSKESKPFLPSLADGSFPLLTGANYATLVAARDLLADYIKASVKLPHTLCQYLTWRYGRIFRTGDSEKAGIVLYNVIPLSSDAEFLNKVVTAITGFAADTTSSYYDYEYTGGEKSQALADMYNAYLSHVIDVEIPEDSHYRYDRKEFVLRTNLDIINPWSLQLTGPSDFDLVYMDSTLDNKTTFMASTVSTSYANAASEQETLFPVVDFRVYGVGLISDFEQTTLDSITLPSENKVCGRTAGAYSWLRFIAGFGVCLNSATKDAKPYSMYAMKIFSAAKACELYNMEIYLRGSDESTDWLFVDVTAPSTDLALVQNDVLRNTQTYAFANLVYEGVKSYVAKEMPKAIAASTEALASVADAIKPGPDPLPSAPQAVKTMSEVAS